MIAPSGKEDYERLIEIWESAVKATHNFLKEEDFLYYKSKLTSYFDHVKLYIYKTTENNICGFIGISNVNIEMLFVHNDFRRKGIGNELLKFVVYGMNIKKVDVNMQNKQALEFYKSFGFAESGYSELDSEGKKYPLINLVLC